MISRFLIPLFLLAATIAIVAIESSQKGRRLEVLFLGAPTANHAGHDPVTRYRILKKALGKDGINLSYSEKPEEAFTTDMLSRYDGLLLYGNWNQRGFMPPSQLKALLSFVENGGGFIPVHCASACYGSSPEFVKLVGGRFKSHGAEVFTVKNEKPDHFILQDLPGYEAWDETYVHEEHADDREILQTRDGEPWSWTRTHGEGRVFYTASGHDHRVWDLPEFHQLLRNGIYWAVGEGNYQSLLDLAMPELEEEPVSLPGFRERKEITTAQKPLSPVESLKLAQVPPGMELSLFAAEPDIVNPIHIAWDHRGRAYVMETIDYPNNLQEGNLGHDRITICEDTDGDGRADKFTRFAEKLSIPTTMVFALGGVICTNGSEILFLKDTDGDDIADVREVLIDGLSTADTHAGISNFRYGMDGWIYATIGYAGFDGTVGGEKHKFRTGVFRFRPDASKLEFLQNTTNNTWGLGFTEEFDILGSTANGNPSFYLSWPADAYKRAKLEQPRTPRADDNPLFFPSSMDVQQVDQFDRYTAGAGHAIYTSRRFPKDYWNRIAFVCAPTGGLVGNFGMESKGAGFQAIQSPNNLYSSADTWSAPVFAEPGPDGAVWIADWYNIIIQHNPTPSEQAAGINAERGKGNAYITPHRDRQHGRIYRIYPGGTKDDSDPGLSLAKPETLISGLQHPNQFWRTHALRLCVENPGLIAVEKLEGIVAAKSTGSAEALHVLQQTGGLKQGIHATALHSGYEPLVRAGVKIADPALLKSVFVQEGTIQAEGRLLGEILVGISRGAADPEIGRAILQVGKDEEKSIFSDPVLGDAWQIAARSQIDTVLSAAESIDIPDGEVDSANLLPNPDFSADTPVGWTDIRFYKGDRESVKVEVSPEGRSGNCLMISAGKAADCGAAAVIPVQPGTRYKLSGWIRTKDVFPKNGQGAMLNIHGGPKTRDVKRTRDWVNVSVEFNSGKRTEVLVHCLFGGYGGATGTAWYDDISLVAIGKETTSLAGSLVALKDFHTNSAKPAVEITRKHTPDPEVHARGEEVYNRTCIACHGMNGKGVPQTFPPLDGSDWLTEDPETAIKIVLHGLMGPISVNGEPYNNVMAPLGPVLKDQEVADVLTFVRQKWTNDLPAVDVGKVKKIRAETADRKAMWTAGDLGR